MRKKLLIFNITLVFTSLLIMFCVCISITTNMSFEITKSKLIETTNLLAVNFDMNSYENLNLPSDSLHTRVTIIASDGKVLKDSQVANVDDLENHLQREEIVNALNNHPQVAIRHSDTLNKSMMYYAVKVGTDSNYILIRTSTLVDSVNEYVYKVLPILIVCFIIIFTIVAVISIRLSKRFLKPLNIVKDNLELLVNGEHIEQELNTEDEDISNMLLDISNVSLKLDSMLSRIKMQNFELESIFKNVTEGIVLLNKDGSIMKMNDSAIKIFNLSNYLDYDYHVLSIDKEFNSALSDVLSLKQISSKLEMTIQKSIYNVSIKYSLEHFVLIVLTDITFQKEMENMRIEFMASASHELKTPLTVITGFNELIERETKENNIKYFSQKISKETDRLMKIIEDMLRISKLETTNDNSPVQNVVIIQQVLNDVINELDILIKEKNLIININCSDDTVNMEYDNLYQLLKNLIENAIKYNKDNGFINISISNKDYFTLEIEDSGIGIEEKEQQRIFERFYRVDKSRSRQNGGTGLGLSIVKHICEIYKLNITLDSTLGVGTKIKITKN